MPKFSPEPRKSREFIKAQRNTRSSFKALRALIPGPVQVQLDLKFEPEETAFEPLKPAQDRSTIDLETFQKQVRTFIESYCSATPIAKLLPLASPQGLQIKGTRGLGKRGLIHTDSLSDGRAGSPVRKLSSESCNRSSMSSERSNYELFLHRLGLQFNQERAALDVWALRHDLVSDEFEVKQYSGNLFVDHAERYRLQMELFRKLGISVFVIGLNSTRSVSRDGEADHG